MNLRLLFVLIPSVVALVMARSGSSSIQVWLVKSQETLRSFIHNPTKRSTVPQFILDTRHRWVLTNQHQLETLPNAQSFLCSKSVSKEPTPSDGLESGEPLEIPEDLFHNLEIDNNRYGRARPGWASALLRLREMKACPRALEQAKSLHIDIYVHDSKHSDWWLQALEMSQPSEELLSIFGDVLESMTSLETLNWGIIKEKTHLFEAAFEARNLALPSIKHLEPGPFSHYVVAMSPNLETLENGGGYNWPHASLPDREDCGLLLVQAALSSPQVKRFTMKTTHWSDGWNPSLVSELIRSMPQIESLGLLGKLGRDYGYESGMWQEKGGRLDVVVKLLSALERLTNLDLPEAHELCLGFDGGHWCGNAYQGKSGRAYGRAVSQERAETIEKAAVIVLRALPNLESFSIGETRPNITKSEDGTVKLTWPWTGRRREWLMETWPEPDDIPEVWDIFDEGFWGSEEL